MIIIIASKWWLSLILSRSLHNEKASKQRSQPEKMKGKRRTEDIYFKPFFLSFRLASLSVRCILNLRLSKQEKPLFLLSLGFYRLLVTLLLLFSFPTAAVIVVVWHGVWVCMCVRKELLVAIYSSPFNSSYLASSFIHSVQLTAFPAFVDSELILYLLFLAFFCYSFFLV